MANIAGYGFRFGGDISVAGDGETGPRGLQGRTGIQGLRGEKGEKGITGNTGNTGKLGERGLQGEEGNPGERGIQGVPGVQNWDVGIIVGFNIADISHKYYIFDDTVNRNVFLPARMSRNGWHIFICNESDTATLTISGNFYGSKDKVVLLSKTGTEIIYYKTGDYFVQCPSRKSMDISRFDSFSLNPLRTDKTYTESVSGTEWSTSVTDLDLKTEAARKTLLNKLVQMRGHKAEFTISLPSILRENLNDITMSDGFTFENLGNAILTIKPEGSDVIKGLTMSYDNSRPMKLPILSGVTLVKQADALWNVIQLSGHNPEGGF